ncbi:WLM domain-containing protein [Phlebopus sp. FC_14]|nr:WLM domain-containing protein [Phlebopus sp. FC_14]
MSDTFVQSFTHLKGMPKAERALPMLQRVASLVKPIMRKRGWVLPVLSEFFPDSPNLVDIKAMIGLSAHQQLRPAWAPDTFYEEDQVVRVMLHEAGYKLTHNVHGPHDEHFYKYLAGLEDEYDALQRSGYAGEGFFSRGQRLGTGVSHNVPPHFARIKALEAAEKRRKTEVLTSGGGRLGGRLGTLKNLSPRELAARAAERRKRDEIECGSGSVALREAAKAAKDSVESKIIIDLTGDDESTPVAAGSSGSHTGTSLKPPTVSQADRSQPPTQRTSNNRKSDTSTTAQWTCIVCTLINEPLALQCGACLAERPQDTLTGWTCLSCGESGMPHEFWSCQFCGAIKKQSTVVG